MQHPGAILLVHGISLPQIFPTFFFFFASLEFVTLFEVIKKLIEKKMKNKLSCRGGCGSYFPGNQVKLNFHVVVVIVVIVVIVIHVVVAIHVVVIFVVVVVVLLLLLLIIIIIIIIIIIRNKVIHVIG